MSERGGVEHFGYIGQPPTPPRDPQTEFVHPKILGWGKKVVVQMHWLHWQDERPWVYFKGCTLSIMVNNCYYVCHCKYFRRELFYPSFSI